MPSHVVVMGAGTVGQSIAQLLCSKQVNVSVVDASRTALDRVEEQLDVQTICGSACEAIPLFQAGVQSADLCLAVTDRDEINLVGASIAKRMGARRSMARIFNPAYRDFSTVDYQRHFEIDRLLSLEHLTALEIAKAIHSPGTFAVENFARGGVQVQEVAVDPKSSAAGVPIKDLKLPPRVRIGLVRKPSQTIIPHGEDILEPGDRVTLIGERNTIGDFEKMLSGMSRESLGIVIAGGGEVGFHLARALQRENDRILLLESDPERCQYLAGKLPHCTVLNADTTNRSEMEEARVGRADVFVAATGRDEDNIICGVEAKELGAGRIVSIVRRPDYANVLEKLGIDIAVSPREVMAREVSGMLSGGVVIAASEIANGTAEVWEVEIEPDSPISRAPLRELQLNGCLIAALVRAEFVTVAGGDDQLRPGDTAVVLLRSDLKEQTRQLFETAKKSSEN